MCVCVCRSGHGLTQPIQSLEGPRQTTHPRALLRPACFYSWSFFVILCGVNFSLSWCSVLARAFRSILGGSFVAKGWGL